jgi:hypothetical protein
VHRASPRCKAHSCDDGHIALTTASLAATGDALAKGSGGGGGGGGGKGNGHSWSSFGGGGVVIDSGCWRWLPGYGRVYVCN